MNSKTKEELEELQIGDKTEIIMEINKVLQKRNIMIQLENKCHSLETIVQRFRTNLNLLNQRGLPRLVAINDKLINLSDYNHKLFNISQDKSKFSRVKVSIIGKSFLKV